MCIAVVNKSKLIDFDTFEIMAENNPDGMGFSFSDGEKIHIHKTLKDIKSLYSLYQKERKSNGGIFLIHARIKTHGLTDMANCHPFMISDKISLIHNGMIDAPILDKTKSDTFHLVQLIMALKNPENLFNPKSIESAWIDNLSTGSKICLLHADGRCVIYGEKLGHWVEDDWFSNKSYEENNYSYFRSCAINSWDDDIYSNWDKPIDNASSYEKRQSILKYFGYNPLSLSIDARIKAVDDLCDEFETDINSLYMDIQSEYESSI
jgi:hypothetical protein